MGFFFFSFFLIFRCQKNQKNEEYIFFLPFWLWYIISNICYILCVCVFWFRVKLIALASALEPLPLSSFFRVRNIMFTCRKDRQTICFCVFRFCFINSRALRIRIRKLQLKFLKMDNEEKGLKNWAFTGHIKDKRGEDSGTPTRRA